MIGNMWGLLAFLSVPAILVIHLFRSRFKPRPVAGLFLWMAPRVDPSTGRRIHRLEPTRSLISELICAILLSALCCDIRLSAGATVDHRVIILDSTASLGAIGRNHDTLNEARDRARALIDELPSTARVTLIASGDHPIVLCGPAGLISEAQEAVDKWAPTSRTHSFESTWALALELGGAEGTPHVISDRPIGDDPHFTWHNVGKALPNIGILNSRRTRGKDDTDRVFCRLAAHAIGPSMTTLSVMVNGITVRTKALRFETAKELTEAFDIDAGSAPIQLTLSHDALEIDNVATLLRPAVDTLTAAIKVQNPDDARDLTKALLSTQAVTIATDSDNETPHILFTDDATLRAPDWTCLFSTTPENGAEGENWLGPFLMDKTHPIMRGTSFDGIVWGGVEPDRAKGFRPLLMAGEIVLLGEQILGDQHLFVFNTVLAQGNLTLSPDWPVLLHNIVKSRQSLLPGFMETNLRAGDDAILHLKEAPTKRLVHVRPDGRSQTYSPRRDIRLSAINQVGIHTVHVDDSEFLLSVNFQDGNVSNLLDARSFSREMSEEHSDRSEVVESAIDQRINLPLIIGAMIAFLANLFFLRPKNSRRVES